MKHDFAFHIDFEAYYRDIQEAVASKERQSADCESLTITSFLEPPVSMSLTSTSFSEIWVYQAALLHQDHQELQER